MIRIKRKVKVQEENENDMYHRSVEGDVHEKIMEEKILNHSNGIIKLVRNTFCMQITKLSHYCTGEKN